LHLQAQFALNAALVSVMSSSVQKAMFSDKLLWLLSLYNKPSF